MIGMSEAIRPAPDSTAPHRLGHEDLIHQFEQDWLAGRRPSLDAYLAGLDSVPLDLLIELAHIDLEFRTKAGQSARAADYLSRYPRLADPDLAVDLIAAEFDLRSRSDPALSFDQIAADYPQYREQLSRYQGRAHTALDTAGFRGLWPAAPGYEILGRLAAGGMGVVYKARDERLGRVVALKFLPAEFARDPARLALFNREARTASALNHPHICTVHDLGEHNGRPFIVMEFVEGKTLRDVIGQPPDAEAAARLIGQAARALAVAHAAGVVHRDIKPENLMVRADGYLKMVDFGLARRLPGAAPAGWSTERATDGGGVIGTVPYMSPEQAKSESLGPASDVFSLGVVLYELATGRHPFEGNVPLDTLNAIVEATPVPASRLNPAIPEALDALISRMLEKNPANRPSAAEVDAALSSLATVAAVAEPVAPPPRAPRWTVGRMEERGELAAALAGAAAGAGEMVCVVGEPGIGKTALVEDFLADLAASGQACHVARGQCSERLAEAEAYLPVLSALDSLLRGPGGSTAARYLRTLAPTWSAELGPAPATGVRSDEGAPAATQTRLKRELIAFLTELSRRAPVVLFIDDLHWADLPTADLLAYLGRHCPGMRLLLVVAYRRDELLLANHPFIPVKRDLQGRGVCRELTLRLLDGADVDHFLDLAFPDHDFPSDLGAAVHARTGGNPLFVAETARFLRDREVIARRDDRWVLTRPVAEAVAEMPESVRGLIRRKLDQLGPADRALLAAGALQGGEFGSAVLARALGNDPAEVEERLQNVEQVHGLVRLIREHEFPDRTVSRRYQFVHAVYQDAVAAELPPARRAAVCRALADALFALHGGQPGQVAAELALLYEAGREFGRAAELFHTAAQNASRVFANREAAGLARRGLGLLRGLPDSADRASLEFRLRMELGLQLQITEGYAAPEVEEIYTRAREVWDRNLTVGAAIDSGSPPTGSLRSPPPPQGGRSELIPPPFVGEVGGASPPGGGGYALPNSATAPTVGPLFPILWGLWLFYKVRSDLGRAHLLAGELLTLAEQSGDPALVLQARQAGAVVALCAGDPATTCRHMEAGVRLYDPDRHRHLTFKYGQDPGVACLAFGAVALWLRGESREAVARSRDAIRLAREGSQPSTLALALHFAAMLHQLRGDPAAVREFASESLSIAVEHRFAFWQAGATVLLGWAAAGGGEADGATVLEQGIEAWRATGSVTYRPYSLALLADARRRYGHRDESLAALDQAERLTEETGERLYEPEIHRLRAELLYYLPGDAAEREYRTALATAEAQQSHALQLRAAVGLGRLLRDRDRIDEARLVVAAAIGSAKGLADYPEMTEAKELLRN
jgi:tetratricopeptide (TPR) repeat protein